MPSTDSSKYNEHYIAKKDCNLLVLNKDVMGELKKNTRLNHYLLTREMNPYLWTSFIEADGEITYGYSLPDGWKHEYIDKLVCELDVDWIEEYIGELGIRKAFKLYEDMGFGDEPPNPTDDKGLQMLFYGVLYEILTINDSIESIEKEEYDKYDWEDEEDGSDDDE